MHLVSVRPVALLGNSKQLCSLVSAYYPCLLLASTRWIIRDVATMIIQLADLVLSDIITCSAKCNVHGRLPVMKRLLMLHFWNSFSLAVIFFLSSYVALPTYCSNRILSLHVFGSWEWRQSLFLNSECSRFEHLNRGCGDRKGRKCRTWLDLEQKEWRVTRREWITSSKAQHWDWWLKTNLLTQGMAVREGRHNCKK